MGIRFVKMCGSGNDFLVVDNRDDVVGQDRAGFARRHCRRRVGVGADGVLLVEPSAGADFRLRVFNRDGSEAEMCGNGARCVARFAMERGIAPERMTMETLAGPVAAEVSGELVTIGMGEVAEPAPAVTLEAAGRTVEVHPIEAGVPHAIVFSEDVERERVEKLGRALRMHPAFEPAGTNVDFVQLSGPASIRIRTYERGVEAETLACGTGAIGSAVVSHLRRGVGGPPIEVQVEGGRLRVEFAEEDGRLRRVRLTGDAVFVYEGELFQGEP